ncbi:15807_t:CDS:2 [Cetraspora pellucida]|uniref:15807_t:CDS:1 n=1 Tax=Cetraspora pellucida TaxID=1433469 RepID=A0A9N9AN12_9GLOM|nr:15807_t:CDS:2 [Cetraspora pellucida]
MSSQQEKTTDEIEGIAYEDEEELQRDRDEMLGREQEMCIKRSERLKEVAKKVRENQDKN